MSNLIPFNFNAKTFRKWVTKEVLPTIRKHGVYTTQLTRILLCLIKT